MKFLVVTKAKMSPPPEMALGLLNAVDAWAKKYKANGKLEQIWGFEYIDDIDYLRVYIWHLRRKLEHDPKEPMYIINELGVGYRFEKQV